jgi:hypothetical protein
VSASSLFNPAGGLRYHLRARSYSKELWQPYRWALGEWLLGWKPPETTLLLVGPSGGYNLQPFVLERFERVVCLEPDPLARWIFKRAIARAPLDRRPKLEFISEDHLVHHPERLQPLLDRLDSPALLFSNILGQLGVLLGTSNAEHPGLVRIREAIGRAIRGRSWVSFHDRVSGTLRPTLEGSTISSRRWSDAEVVERAFAAGELEATEPSELLDHMTQGFFPENVPHAYFVWELEPGVFHLIEGIACVRGRARMQSEGLA